jgi:hypothetical protein
MIMTRHRKPRMLSCLCFAVLTIGVAAGGAPAAGPPAERATYAVAARAQRIGEQVLIEMTLTRPKPGGGDETLSAPRVIIVEGGRGSISIGPVDEGQPDEIESGFRIDVISVKGTGRVLVVAAVVEQAATIWADAQTVNVAAEREREREREREKPGLKV